MFNFTGTFFLWFYTSLENKQNKKNIELIFQSPREFESNGQIHKRQMMLSTNKLKFDLQYSDLLVAAAVLVYTR